MKEIERLKIKLEQLGLWNSTTEKLVNTHPLKHANIYDWLVVRDKFSGSLGPITLQQLQEQYVLKNPTSDTTSIHFLSTPQEHPRLSRILHGNHYAHFVSAHQKKPEAIKFFRNIVLNMQSKINPTLDSAIFENILVELMHFTFESLQYVSNLLTENQLVSAKDIKELVFFVKSVEQKKYTCSSCKSISSPDRKNFKIILFIFSRRQHCIANRTIWG